jgi:4-hydroxy-3-polyprenylbenzoate decarboxylase
MKTLAAISYSLSDNLLVRAADVALKERRPLVVAPRETPLHLGHLRAMVQLTEMGAIVAPPMPAFYHRPGTVGEIVDQTVGRVCDLLGVRLPGELFARWRDPTGD